MLTTKCLCGFTQPQQRTTCCSDAANTQGLYQVRDARLTRAALHHTHLSPITIPLLQLVLIFFYIPFILDFLGRITSSEADCYAHSSVVGRSLAQLDTFVSPAKTAEPIEMPFGGLIWVGPSNHVLDGAPISLLRLTCWFLLPILFCAPLAFYHNCVLFLQCTYC